MKKFLKVCLIIGFCMTLLGGILLAVGMAVTGGEVWKQERNSSVQMINITPEEEIKNLSISLKAGSIIIKKGPVFQVTAADSEEAFDCYVDGDTLVIKENGKKRWPEIQFFGIRITRDGIFRNDREIVIEVPDSMIFSDMHLEVDAGSLEAEAMSVSGNFYADVNAGNLEAKNLKVEGISSFNVNAGRIDVSKFDGKETKISCNVGNVSIKGDIMGDVDADCGGGEISMKLSGIMEQYRYSGSSHMGDISIGRYSLSEIGDIAVQGPYKMHLKCQMGDIDIKER